VQGIAGEDHGEEEVPGPTKRRRRGRTLLDAAIRPVAAQAVAAGESQAAAYHAEALCRSWEKAVGVLATCGQRGVETRLRGCIRHWAANMRVVRLVEQVSLMESLLMA
jgi:hypothetical protein